MAHLNTVFYVNTRKNIENSLGRIFWRDELFLAPFSFLCVSLAVQLMQQVLSTKRNQTHTWELASGFGSRSRNGNPVPVSNGWRAHAATRREWGDKRRDRDWWSWWKVVTLESVFVREEYGCQCDKLIQVGELNKAWEPLLSCLSKTKLSNCAHKGRKEGENTGRVAAERLTIWPGPHWSDRWCFVCGPDTAQTRH